MNNLSHSNSISVLAKINGMNKLKEIIFFLLFKKSFCTIFINLIKIKSSFGI